MLRRFARSCGLVLLLAAGPVWAGQLTDTATFTFEPEFWVLNGDLQRQPFVPEIQKLNVPPITVTQALTVTTNAEGLVTQIATFPADFVGGTMITFSETKPTPTVPAKDEADCQGPFVGDDFTFMPNPAKNQRRCILLPRPTNRNSPFTGRFEITVDNEAGTGMFNPAGNWSSQVAVNLSTRLILSLKDSFFVDLSANLFIPSGVGATLPPPGTVMFTGLIAGPDIPIEGSVTPRRFTTGTVMVMKQIITKREDDSDLGEPIGFKDFTFTARGDATPMRLALVTPVVIDGVAGVGDQAVPIPIIGFARATTVGFTYKVPEIGGWLAVGAGVLGVGALAHRRGRPSRGETARQGAEMRRRSSTPVRNAG